MTKRPVAWVPENGGAESPLAPLAEAHTGLLRERKTDIRRDVFFIAVSLP